MSDDRKADRASEVVRRRYNRVAWVYDLNPMEISEDLRRLVVQQARGRVLEVGIGTGRNLGLYPPDVEITGIDFSPGMLARARKRLARLGLTNVTLLEMDAQHLQFPDNTFDTVISTCVFCTVPDPVQGLREIRRVLKPTGTLYMLEHMRSSRPVLGLLMDIFDPIFYSIVGTHINRRTFENIAAAGLHVTHSEALSGDIVFRIAATPNKGE